MSDMTGAANHCSVGHQCLRTVVQMCGYMVGRKRGRICRDVVYGHIPVCRDIAGLDLFHWISVCDGVIYMPGCRSYLELTLTNIYTRQHQDSLMCVPLSEFLLLCNYYSWERSWLSSSQCVNSYRPRKRVEAKSETENNSCVPCCAVVSIQALHSRWSRTPALRLYADAFAQATWIEWLHKPPG